MKLSFQSQLEHELAQINAYYWVDYCHGRFAGDGPDHDLLKSIEVHVNRNETEAGLPAVGNAYWNGEKRSLNFSRGGMLPNGVAVLNTAYCDIVIHEYGYALLQCWGGQFLDGNGRAYAEGFGDSLVILVSGQPEFGRSLQGKGIALRDARKPARFQRRPLKPHVAGTAYSGFVWRLVENLRVTYRDKGGDQKAIQVAESLILDAARKHPHDIPSAVRESFLSDASAAFPLAGNPYKGPHFKELSDAASRTDITLEFVPIIPAH